MLAKSTNANPAIAKPAKKKLKKKHSIIGNENKASLPHTGIEQCFLKKRPYFMQASPEYEPINLQAKSSALESQLTR